MCLILDNIDYIFRPGDFLSWDMGVGYLNFGTDFKRSAYILKDDETNAPAGLKRAWLKGLNAREIIRKTFKSGLNARQSLKNIVNTLIRQSRSEENQYINRRKQNLIPKTFKKMKDFLRFFKVFVYFSQPPPPSERLNKLLIGNISHYVPPMPNW